MKRSILRALALCLTTTFATGYAWAQDDKEKSNPGQGVPGSSTSPYSSGTRVSSASKQSGEAVRLTKVLNTSLSSQTGENLGQVQDVVIDRNGQIQFVVIQLSSSAAGEPGTSAGISTGVGTRTTITTPGASSTTAYGATAGGKLVAIPWRLLSHSSEGQCTVTVDRAKLESAPTFSSSSWPTMDSAWMQRIYSHFGVDATGTGAPGNSSGTGTGLGNPSTPGVPSTPGTPDISPPPSATAPGTTPGAGAGTGTGTGGSK